MTTYTIKVDTQQASKIIADRLNVKVPKILGESVKTTTDKVASTAQSICPVDTGELRSSIKAEKVSEFEGRVIATAEHAPFVEFGTYKMQAQPFLGPAAEQHRTEFVRDTKSKVKSAVENG
jgi:HK97 gp10 family phage protein